MPPLPERTAELLANDPCQPLRVFQADSGATVTVFSLSEKFQIICHGDRFLDLELIEALIQHHRINRYRQSLSQRV